MTALMTSQTPAEIHVLCIGNAIVDVLSQTEDAFLAHEGLVKGSMNLIDAERARTLYDRMGPATEISGGSAGNTSVGVTSLGGRAAFIGKVADDQLGDIFAHDLRSTGVTFDVARLTGAEPTARSMILITPDGERTMNTHLGACVALGPGDVDEALVARSAITYFEGYLWDPPHAKEAFRLAARIAHAHGRKVAISLSDSFCVERWRPEFLGLLRDGTVDILLANEAEALALYETDDLAVATARLAEDCPLSVVTLGRRGAIAITPGGIEEAASHPVDKVVDRTGAGDLFAAGFLFGVATERSLTDAIRLGNVSAAEVITHVGARPQTPLASLVAEDEARRAA
ncbi:MAG: adenosine kinase [Pseudomonadota bacterium]